MNDALQKSDEPNEFSDSSLACMKLKAAREASGRSPNEIKALAGIIGSYYDLEDRGTSLYTNISLGELSRLSSVLGISTRSIFEDEIGGSLITPQQLSKKLQSYLNSTGMCIAGIEDRVGYNIEPFLSDPENVLCWNIDCLRSVCAELSLNWRLALP